MTKRISALELVSKSQPKNRSTWYENLSNKDKNYVDEVIGIMKNNQCCIPTLVAKSLVKELELTCSIDTVIRYIKKVLNA